MTEKRTRQRVYRHYPAARLPEELRGEIPVDALVTITIEWEETVTSDASDDLDAVPSENAKDQDSI